MIDGNNIDDIKDALRRYYPKENPDEAINNALETFRAYGYQSVETLRGWCMASMRDLYHQMRQVGDFPGALRAVEKLSQYAEREHRGGKLDLDI